MTHDQPPRTGLGPRNPDDPQAVSARTRGGSSANRTGTRTTPPTSSPSRG